jgi:iron complex outermembrane receptor protein
MVHLCARGSSSHGRFLARIVTSSVAAATLFHPSSIQAQSAGQSSQPAATFQLPPLLVTAQKEPADPQSLPISLTTVSKEALQNAGVQIVSEAGVYAPNLQFTEFTARKLSNARFRGIGASPANPAITTLFDGVPQLHANSASMDLIDIEQIEFVRGPQSTLFGRNALGGLINVTSARPSLGDWSGSLSVPFANNDARDVRGSLAGPLVDGRLGMAVSLQYGRREGFTTNDNTGNDLDYRSAFAGKGQVLWTPTRNWETRVIINGERARDGDYALSDLGGLRQNPFHTARDFEGYTNRDVFGTTILARGELSRVTLSTTTGFVKWKTEDATDLDYSPLPLLTRDNAEESFQFTQEVRVASSAAAPVRLSDGAVLKWQAGVFLFTQNYDQDAVNTFSPFLLSPLIPFSVTQTSPQAALDDAGIGVYGQGTATLAERFDLTAGLRVDHEQKDAVLSTFFTPALAPARNVDAKESFSNVSPQFAAAVRLQPGKTVYASVAKGYKAGGFNAASPSGSESYGEEHTWNVEGGIKTAWASNRVSANAAVFRIDWEDLQLNLPNPQVPGEFYIANVGGATSSGVELELTARIHPSLDVFGSLGYTRARFSQGSVSSGVDVSGNTVPNTPDYTATLGAQVSHDLRPGASLYGRAEVTLSGAFQYDDLNSAEQEAYSLANFRGGVRGRYVFVEAWIRNAFDTHYIPVAFAYAPFAPSGFIGEMGRPRTFGISGGVTF